MKPCPNYGHSSVVVVRHCCERGCHHVLIQNLAIVGVIVRLVIILYADVEYNHLRSVCRGYASELILCYPLARHRADGSKSACHLVHLAEKIPCGNDCVATVHSAARWSHSSDPRHLVKYEVRAHQWFCRCGSRLCHLKRIRSRLNRGNLAVDQC